MKHRATLVVVLTSAGLVACGSSGVSQKAAIEQIVRVSAVKAGDTQLKLYGVRVSKRDPQYAIAREEFTRTSGRRWAHTWFLRRSGTSWRVTFVGNLFPTCSAAPAKMRRELYGTAACYPRRGVYTLIPWTRGRSVRLRYCERPGGPGNFIAASAGVTCHTAAIVAHAVESLPCYARSQCQVDSFRCVGYWNGRYGGTFETNHHALCSNRSRRIEWDGG